MKILVADDDPWSAEVLAAILCSAGHECVLASNGQDAWDAILAPDPPQVVFLDWMMPGIDGIEVCRRIRGLDGPEYTYIFIVSARNKQQDVLFGFESGVDDFIIKPYTPDDILARIKVAERLVHSFSARSGLARVLAEARQAPGGDVIVRTTDRVGRIIFHQGRVAWAHVSDEPGSLRAVLAGEPGITEDDVREVLEECQATGQNFASVLVSWDLISLERLHDLLRGWIRARIASIAAFPRPLVLFSPEKRASTTGLLFDPEEVLSPELASTARRVPAGSSGVETPAASEADAGPEVALTENLERAVAIAGAHAVAVFDLRNGRCLGKRGRELDVDIVWSQIRLATQAGMWEQMEDMLISTHGMSHIVRWYSRTPPRLIFFTVDRTVPIALARFSLTRCLPTG